MTNILRISACLSVLVGMPASGQAQYFKAGYPACVSERKLDEFLNMTDDGTRFEYLSAGWCVYPKGDSEIAVVSVTPSKYVEVDLPAGAQRVRLWASQLAVARRQQPPRHNLLFSNTLDRESECYLISMVTRKYDERSDAVAKSVVNANERPGWRLKDSYIREIASRNHELIVDWNGGRCVAELDFEAVENIGCALEPGRFNECREGATDANRAIPSMCFVNLCTQRVTLQERR